MSDLLHALLRLRRHDDLDWALHPDGTIELWPSSRLPAVVTAVAGVLGPLGGTVAGDRWRIAADHPEWPLLREAVLAERDG
ncbi:MAG: hypothetical protein IT204_22770 [Fimbriimonadaceae bacterium]|nr:hypothetical protein [Fimbriimonadaceae bacterium]